MLALFGPSLALEIQGAVVSSPPWGIDNGRPIEHLSSAFGNDSIEAHDYWIPDELKVRWACIDEAQEDLRTIIADEASALEGSPDAPFAVSEPHVDLRNMLAIAMDAATNVAGYFSNFTYFQQ